MSCVGESLLSHWVVRRLDIDDKLFERFAVEHYRGIELSARQITAMKCDLGGLAWFDHRRKNRVNPWGGREIEAIEIVGTALGVGELVKADDIVAVVGRREVENAVARRQGTMIGDHFPGGVVDPHFGMEPAIERGAQA